MASKIKVDTIETADGAGNITVNNPIIGTGLTISSNGHEVTKLHRNLEVQTYGYLGTRLQFGANYNGSAVYPVSISGIITNSGTAAWLSTEMDGVEVLRVMGDGRGLSQFTAKAWVNFNGTGTVAIRDSHNVSSIADFNTGTYAVNFSNNMGNEDYAVSGLADGTYNGTTLSIGHGDSDTSYQFVGGFEIETRGSGVNHSLYDCLTVMTTIFGD